MNIMFALEPKNVSDHEKKKVSLDIKFPKKHIFCLLQYIIMGVPPAG